MKEGWMAKMVAAGQPGMLARFDCLRNLVACLPRGRHFVEWRGKETKLFFSYCITRVCARVA